MKIYEIGTGYTPIPAQMGAATEIVVEELTRSLRNNGEDAEIIQESSIEDTLSAGAEISLSVNTEKVNVFTADGAQNILTGVKNDNA